MTIERGKWLTAFLVLAIAYSCWGVGIYVFKWRTLALVFPLWAVVALGTIAVLRILSLLAVWFWSRSGVIANISLTVLGLAILVAVGQPSLFGIPAALILVALVWRKWKYMHWGLSLTPNLAGAAQPTAAADASISPDKVEPQT